MARPDARRRRRGGRRAADVAGVGDARLAGRSRRRLLVAGRRRRPRVRAQPPRSRRARHRDRSRDRQGAVAAEVPRRRSPRTSTPMHMAKGPNSTPLVAGGRVYTLGVTGVLSAWRVADGTLAWRKDYSRVGRHVEAVLRHGDVAAARGRLPDRAGRQRRARRPRDGARSGDRRRALDLEGPGPGYASPIAVTVGGRAADRHDDQSVDRRHRRQDRRRRSGRSPFPDEWHENIVTPVWTGTHLIVSGVRQGTQAFALDASERQRGRRRRRGRMPTSRCT